MLLTTLVTAAFVAPPALRALPRQTPGNPTVASSGVTVLRFGKLWDGSKVTTDAVVVVDAPAELQVQRMVEDRGWTREEAESRIAAQATREQRLGIATHVVDNTGSLDDLRRQVEAIYDELAGQA